MVSLEKFYNKNKLSRGKAATLIATVALTGAGCGPIYGSGSHKDKGISDCPSGYESEKVISNQNAVIVAFESAGQDLAADYKSGGSRNAKVRNAFLELFAPNNGTNNYFETSGRISPDAYQADDPSELMCHIDKTKDETVTVLSPRAIQDVIILKKAGHPVNLPENAVK
jgi:hypothetical protein